MRLHQQQVKTWKISVLLASVALLLALFVVAPPVHHAGASAPKPRTASSGCVTQVDRVMSNTGWVNDSGGGLTNTYIYAQVVAKVDYLDGTYCSHAYGRMGIWYRATFSQCVVMHTLFAGEAWGGAWTFNPAYGRATCGVNGQQYTDSTPVYYVPASNWCRLQDNAWGNYGYYQGLQLTSRWYPQGHC